MPARFHEKDVKAGLKDKRKLSLFLDSIVKRYAGETKRATLNYIFCSDEFLLEINQQYLNHDTLTDIITFDLSDTPGKITGEIYISVDRVKENAIKFNVAYTDEMHRVIFHGALHLCGFKDKKPADQKIMRQMENKCLEEYIQKT